MQKIIPLHSLVIGVGPSPSNRDRVIKSHFQDYEVLSVTDVAHDVLGTRDKSIYEKHHEDLYHELYRRASLKLRLGERAVIDAPNLFREDRLFLASLGSEYGAPVFYLTSDPETDNEEAKRRFKHAERDIMRGDGVAEIIDWRLHTPAPVAKQKPTLETMRAKWDGITVVADVHGMLQSALSAISWAQSRNHYLVFLGDIIDYGPDTLEVCDEVYRLVMRGNGELIRGNHERKIQRWINNSGRPMRLSDGNRVTTNAIAALDEKRRRQWLNRFCALMAHASDYRKIGDVLLTHGGMHPKFWSGDASRHDVERYCLFGEVDGFFDGKPNRVYGWLDHIPENTTVIVGHDIRSSQYPMRIANKVGGEAIFLDTGCGKGGHLSSVDLKFSDGGPRVLNFNIH